MKNSYSLGLLISIVAFFLGCKESSVNAPKKIACIGTSITESYGQPSDKAYPAVLQTLENPSGNKVLNYGVGGCTVLKKGDSPYWLAQKYQYAIDWKPTIVIIEFGTNDSKKQNWAYKGDFKNDYLALIKSFQNLSSSPEIYLCVPPPAFSKNFDIDSTVVKNEIVPLIRTLAKENNLKMIDLYTLLLDKSNLFIDGIHPTQEGNVLIANEVFKVLSEN
ncbi:GDSL-type esterase/lipase family protein [Spirosoma agri]|uniref:Sialate O-acetylesterase n=1 Tax=Spirosoma agri TaxID=1987381 RepID=A0A6M0IEP9_9BACT|nr:GDSL-type esterase/lipase family protein [Spirosoma agri]NEU65543.1 sialate O-acetylesterase [Spirosoma agri]